MEKKLLLLGALRHHEMHGYQLNEMLGPDSALPITLTKSNAYKLLKDMEEDAWVVSHEEREGNRPPRRVYSITSVGEQAFVEMLRISLAGYSSPELPSAAPLNYLENLPREEVVTLLLERQQQIEVHFQAIDALSQDVRQTHPGIAYMHRHYVAELQWTDELIKQLKQTTISKSSTEVN